MSLRSRWQLLRKASISLTALVGSIASPACAVTQQMTPPSVFGNGKGLSVAGAVLAVPAGSTNPAATYRLQPGRYSPAILAKIKHSGFDFIRLVVTPMPLMTSDNAARNRAASWVSALIDEATAAGLHVVVDMHFWPSDIIKQDDVSTSIKGRQALLQGQLTIAQMLTSKAPGLVLFEILNEPHCNPREGPNSWAALQPAIYFAIRQVAPRLPLVLESCRALPDTLTALDPSPYRGDKNVYWSFHYYDFFGAQETLKLSHVPFPPNPALASSVSAFHDMIPVSTALSDPKVIGKLRDYLLNDRGAGTIRAKMTAIATWAKQNNISTDHIYMGEFAPLLSKRSENTEIIPDGLRWIETVRHEAERQGFSWSYWLYPDKNSFVYDTSVDFFTPQADAALGLEPR